jgi:hypothetical protein
VGIAGDAEAPTMALEQVGAAVVAQPVDEGLDLLGSRARGHSRSTSTRYPSSALASS